MDFALLPQATIVGRITNKVSLQRSRRKTLYLPLLIYMYHEGHAKLMPMVAFNKEAHRIAKQVQQGDLMKFTVRIDPVPNHQFINPTLVINDASFLEPKTMRKIYHGKHGTQLKVLFPVMPINYGAYRHKPAHKQNMHANMSAKPKKSTKKQSEQSSVDVDIITPTEKKDSQTSESASERPTSATSSKATDHANHASAASQSSESDSGDWMDNILSKTKVPFPGMH